MNRKRKNGESFKAYHRNLKSEEIELREKLKGRLVYSNVFHRTKRGVYIPARSDGVGGYIVPSQALTGEI